MTSLTPIAAGPPDPGRPLRRRGHAALAPVPPRPFQAARRILGGASPFQRTLERLAAEPFAAPILIGAAASRDLVAEQAGEVGVGIELALEPEGRDTLAAVALAARRDPLATVPVVPSDHLIPDREAFARSAAAAACIAAAGRIVVLGEIARHAPEALEAVERAIDEGRPDAGALRLGNAFLDAPRISFDRAVTEKTDRGAVVAAGFRWSDIGDWKAVWEQGPRDGAGVVSRGRVHARDVATRHRGSRPRRGP